ncbi:MAG TPA: undecaprenyldiphospho-muramoylpentapeptide beta-N-acetylglucosaminyltransferase [Rickettsiales bacterium]|nr:undecaprenyldiphospho-muramoylpentapeptide beta-N-acetylglucosaminyltransferase [Rickettsiales bacterium]
MKEKKVKPKIFLATGGSGGHIFPALSVANELTKNDFNVCVIADKVFERYSNGNINNRIINTGKTLNSFFNIKEIIKGVLQSRHLIKKENPDLVVAFGSYATLPVLISCIITKTPFMLHEQNVYIGKINKFFAKYSQKVMTSYHELYGVSFNDMEKIVFTGNPVRKEIQRLSNIEYKYPNEEKFNILITGGSSGAEIFSEYLPKIFDFSHKEEQKRIKIFHQVREEYLDQVKEYYKKINVEAIVSTFFKNIDELLEKAHLVIGRSGSGTLNEVAIAGKPIVLIPLKNSSNNHQEINAKLFSKNKAALIVLEKNFNIKDFQRLFFDLIQNKKLLEEMAKNIKNMSVINADIRIVDIIKEKIQF